MVAETPTAFKELESEVVEETGLSCCICLEGYRNQPQKVREGRRGRETDNVIIINFLQILGIYTYTRKVLMMTVFKVSG